MKESKTRARTERDRMEKELYKTKQDVRANVFQIEMIKLWCSCNVLYYVSTHFTIILRQA